jgi:hypothetical protein
MSVQQRGNFLTASPPSFSTTSTGGIFTVNDAAALLAATQWPRGPLAPTNLAASAGNAQLSLTWTAPTTTHGTITNYLVEYTASGGSAAYVLTNSTSALYSLTGLTNNTEYTVRVAAVNFTAGDWSGPYTNTPQARSVNVFPATITATNNWVYTWFGNGTVGSPLTTGGNFGEAQFSQALYKGSEFTCITSGTLYFRIGADIEKGDYSYGGLIQYKKNGIISSSWATSQVNSGGFSTRGLTVAANDVVNLELINVEYPRTPISVWIQ